MPPQPEGIWTTRVGKWHNSTGPDRYRRAVYTYIKRSNVYPSFLTFDASDHLISLSRRIPTNTPLQALVTLNDPVYRETAEALANRMHENFPDNKGEKVLDDRLNYGAKKVLSRNLTAGELKTLRQLYDGLIKNNGANDYKALTGTAIALLNLDAALTR